MEKAGGRSSDLAGLEGHGSACRERNCKTGLTPPGLDAQCNIIRDTIYDTVRRGRGMITLKMILHKWFTKRLRFPNGIPRAAVRNPDMEHTIITWKEPPA